MLDNPIGITSFEKGLKTCAIDAEIKKYKRIIKRKKQKHDKIVLLAKSKLNSRELLISEDLLNTNISHDGFALINTVLKESDDMKKEIKNLKT